MKFRLVSRVTVSAYTEVEAETLEQAIKISETRPVEFEGGACSRAEHWLIGDADGMAQNIEADAD